MILLFSLLEPFPCVALTQCHKYSCLLCGSLTLLILHNPNSLGPSDNVIDNVKDSCPQTKCHWTSEISYFKPIQPSGKTERSLSKIITIKKQRKGNFIKSLEQILKTNTCFPLMLTKCSATALSTASSVSKDKNPKPSVVTTKQKNILA